MNYFLDSNVILGYIFTLDNCFDSVSVFLIENQNYFYSDHVDEEVKKVFQEKNNQYQLFLLKVCRCINQIKDNDLINEFHLHEQINSFKSIGELKVFEMHEVLDKIWKELDFNENHDSFEVKLKFNGFQNDFYSSNCYRKNYIFNKMTQIPNHIKKDKQILDMIKKESLRHDFLYDEDENILFDVNEYCNKNKHLNLKFVSVDQDFLKAIEILMEYLCINECINLGKFKNC